MPATLQWLGHATVKLTLDDGRVAIIDPWLKENPSCPAEHKEVSRCDMIILTHGHGDHVGDVPDLLSRFEPTLVANYELAAYYQRTVGKGNIVGMNTGGTAEFDGLSVTLTRAYHSSSITTPKGEVLYGGMPNGVVLQMEGLATLYHAGDTDVFSDMQLIAKLYKPVVCVLPIGDHFTMGSAGAAMAMELMSAKIVVPIHYGTFPMLAQSADGFRYALPVSLRDSVAVLDPGQEVRWTAEGIGP